MKFVYSFWFLEDFILYLKKYFCAFYMFKPIWFINNQKKYKWKVKRMPNEKLNLYSLWFVIKLFF